MNHKLDYCFLNFQVNPVVTFYCSLKSFSGFGFFGARSVDENKKRGPGVKARNEFDENYLSYQYREFKNI